MPENATGEYSDRNEIAAMLSESGIAPRYGDGTVFGEPVVIVDQISMDRSGYLYRLYSAGGALLAECVEQIESYDIAETPLNEAIRKNTTETMEFRDPQGRPWASLTHRKVWKSKVSVTGPDGGEIGRFAQKNVLGKVSFAITSHGSITGKLRSTGTRLEQFDLTDQSGNALGRFVKLGGYSRWRPLVRDARTVGRYVLELSARLPQPLATMAVVSPVAIDLAFNMDPAGYRR